MVDVGYQKPSNAILVAGTPFKQTLKVENAANMYPGRLVIQGTNDDDITVAGVYALNAMAVGWLSYEQTTKKYRPATVDTIYLVNAQAVVLNGGGFIVVAALAASQGTLKKGDALVMAADGTLKKAAVIQITASGAGNITDGQTPGSGSLGDDGPIVAYAEESIADVAAIQDIMVRSVI
jgi:hypothetical protein